MNRKFSVIIVVLFALAALEFGMLGARAAATSGNARATLPPVAERGRPRTPTPPPNRPAAAIQLSADKLSVDCDQGGVARVSVKLFDASGRAVPAGTLVTFNVQNGYAIPDRAEAARGTASSEVHVFSDPAYGPNVVVDSGDLEGGIRVRCNPRGGNCSVSPPGVSPPCPTRYPCNPSPGSGPISPPCPAATRTPSSPPQCAISPPSVSPPCATPEPPSPPPCNPSPGAGAMSPPCATPTLSPCGDGITSPPAISPPCPTSTPFPTPTPPGPPDYTFAIDCDVNTPGIQDACTVPLGTTKLDVGVVVENHGAVNSTLAAFNFDLHDSDSTLLRPVAGVDSNLDANPDFNQAELPGSAWTCTPPNPSPDTGQDGSGKADSLLSCFVFGAVPPFTVIGTQSTIRLASVHYAVLPPQSGLVHLTLGSVALADGDFTELGSCNPVISNAATCLGATITIGQP